MGWVPPQAPPITDPRARERYRSQLVQALGYDPAVDRKPRFQTLRFIYRACGPSIGIGKRPRWFRRQVQRWSGYRR